MTDQPQIRRRPDGSIDTAHYLVQGRAYRAEAARAGLRRSAARPAARFWVWPPWWRWCRFSAGKAKGDGALLRERVARPAAFR